ncbi:MAG: hypothetical protein K5768_10580 [Firmicutes bacterium]|nr:hypothetical protein [Bacillota bacterium]
MKKVLLFILVISIILTTNAFALEYKNYEITDELPQGWTLGEVGSYASVGITEYSGEKSILLSVDTSSAPSTMSEKANLYSESFSLTGMQVFSFRMAVNTSNSCFKRIQICDAAADSGYTLMQIQNNNLKVGSVTEDDVIADNTFFDISIAIDSTKSPSPVKAWLNGECVVDDATVNLSAYAGKNIKLRFWNNFSNKKMSSLWYISKYERIDGAEYNPISAPENENSTVDSSAIENITVDFGTVIPNLSAKTVTLEVKDNGSSDYATVAISKTADLHSLCVTPTSGFSAQKSYKLTVAVGNDVFGVSHDDYVTSFTTVQSGYILPQCTISADRTVYTVGKTINITSDVTDGTYPVTKAELYVNGELKATKTDGDDFSFTAELGQSSAYVKVYDTGNSMVQSNTVNFTVKQNALPQITLNLSDGDAVSRGYKITLSATDSDGTVEKVILKLGGNKVAEESASSLEWTVTDSTAFGEYELEAIAIDDDEDEKTVSLQLKIENKLPQITLNVSENQALEYGYAIVASAEDPDGTVVKVILKLDGAKVKEASTSSLEWTVPESVTFGKHTVEVLALDSNNGWNSTKVQIELSKYTVVPKTEIDFSNAEINITEGSASVKGLTACTNTTSGSVRYIKNAPIDEDHANCLLIGSENLVSGGSTAWLGMNITLKDIAVFETNVYSTHSKVREFISLKNGSVSNTLAMFYEGKITFSDGTTEHYVPMEMNKWYEVRAEIDLRTNKYTLIINGETVAQNYSLKNQLDGITAIRIEVAKYESGDAYVAINKFNTYEKVGFLSVSGVEYLKYNETSEEYDTVSGAGADKILLALNTSALVMKNGSKKNDDSDGIDDVKLFAEGKAVSFEAGDIESGKLPIKPAYALEAGCSYKVELYYTFGQSKYKAEFSFETPLESGKEGIATPEFVMENESIKFTANVQSTENKTVQVIIAKFRNDIMEEIKACDALLTANSNTPVVSPAVTFEDGEDVTYKIYIWNGWADRTAIGNKIFELSN